VCLPQYAESIANPVPREYGLHYIFQHHIVLLARVRA